MNCYKFLIILVTLLRSIYCIVLLVQALKLEIWQTSGSMKREDDKWGGGSLPETVTQVALKNRVKNRFVWDSIVPRVD